MTAGSLPPLPRGPCRPDGSRSAMSTRAIRTSEALTGPETSRSRPLWSPATTPRRRIGPAAPSRSRSRSVTPWAIPSPPPASSSRPYRSSTPRGRPTPHREGQRQPRRCLPQDRVGVQVQARHERPRPREIHVAGHDWQRPGEARPGVRRQVIRPGPAVAKIRWLDGCHRRDRGGDSLAGAGLLK